MGSLGDAEDNALCERVPATLGCALLDRMTVKAQAEGWMAVLDFIEGF